MAFKMAPKSPLLMKAMGYASPAKQTMKSGSSMTAAEKKAMNDKSVFGPDGKNVAKPPKGKSKSKYDKSPAKQTAEEKVLTPKEKALQKLQEANEDNEVSNIEKETSKVKKNSTKKRKQATRKDSQAERRTEKTKRLEERIERRKKRRSPAKQTAKQKANLPKEVVNAIAAKSPAKEIDKAGQRIIRQGEKAKAAYKAGDTKKGDRHKVRAKRMNGRYNAKMLKNNLKGGRDEVSEFEKNIKIQEKFDAKIEKAKGNTKKIARLTKRANSKMDRSAN